MRPTTHGKWPLVCPGMELKTIRLLRRETGHPGPPCYWGAVSREVFSKSGEVTQVSGRANAWADAHPLGVARQMRAVTGLPSHWVGSRFHVRRRGPLRGCPFKLSISHARKKRQNRRPTLALSTAFATTQNISSFTPMDRRQRMAQMAQG